MKTEAGQAKQLVAVTTVLRVFVTDASPAIRAFPDYISTAGVNSCILDVRHLIDFTIHLQFTRLVTCNDVTNSESGSC